MGKKFEHHARGNKVDFGNYDVDVTETDFTSRDMVYSTESISTHDITYAREHNTNGYYELAEIDSSKLFDDYNDHFDYTTSGVSYDEGDRGRVPQPGRREQLHAKQKYHEKSKDYYNPEGNKYLSSDEFHANRKFRARWTKPSYLNYAVKVEKDLSLHKEHTKLLKHGQEYEDLINEEPEKDYKHHENFKPQEKIHHKPKFKKIEDARLEENIKSKKRPSKGYKVLAFQEPRLKTVIEKKPIIAEETSQQSEVEMRNHEYPVLAFKNSSGKGKQEMVYLPLLVMNGQSFKDKLTMKPNTKPVQQDNFQVYAANVEDQQNIFQKLSRAQNNLNEIHEKSQSQEKVSMYEGSVIPQENLNRDNHTTQGYNFPPSGTTNPHTYKVDVDILPEVQKYGEKYETDINNGGQSEQYSEGKNVNSPLHSFITKSMLTKQSHDPLEDNYPVKKDYITVKSSMQAKNQSISQYQTNHEFANEEYFGIQERLSNQYKMSLTPSVLINIERIAEEIENSKNKKPNEKIVRKGSSQTPYLNLNKQINSKREPTYLSMFIGEETPKLSTLREEENTGMNGLTFEDDFQNKLNKETSETLKYFPQISDTIFSENKSEFSALKPEINHPLYIQNELSSTPYKEKNDLSQHSSTTLNQFKSQVFNVELEEKRSMSKVSKESVRRSKDKQYQMKSDELSPQSKKSTDQRGSRFDGDNEHINKEDGPILSKKRSSHSIAELPRTKSMDKMENDDSTDNYEEMNSQPKEHSERPSRNHANSNIYETTDSEARPRLSKRNSKTYSGGRSSGVKKFFTRSKSKNEETEEDEAENPQSENRYNLSKKNSKADMDSGRKRSGVKKLFSRSGSKTEETGDEDEPKKTQSFLGILRKRKQPSKSEQKLNKTSSRDSGFINTDTTVEKHYESVAFCVLIIRECANFFLGTNIYQHTMDMLSLF